MNEYTAKRTRELLAFFAIALMIAGCSHPVSEQSKIESYKKVETGKGLFVPEIETFETPEFVILREKAEGAKKAVDQLIDTRKKLMTKFTELHPLVKKNSREFKQALMEFDRLSNDLSKHSLKLKHQWADRPV